MLLTYCLNLYAIVIVLKLLSICVGGGVGDIFNHKWLFWLNTMETKLNKNKSISSSITILSPPK